MPEALQTARALALKHPLQLSAQLQHLEIQLPVFVSLGLKFPFAAASSASFSSTVRSVSSSLTLGTMSQ
jgi:hypothetical protein